MLEQHTAHSDQQRILLAHGNGGKLQQKLLQELILPAWQEVVLPATRDSQVLDWSPQKLVISTDSYVVNPLFFPGGDIGKLAVCGTCNDIAMSGAQPRYLTCSFILEEGFLFSQFTKILNSIGQSARDLGVKIAAGDIKVVEKGKGDGIFINTAGVGELDDKKTIPGPNRLEPGQRLIVSGDLSRHGLTIMMMRDGLQFTSDLKSDCAPLWPTVRALGEAGIELLCLRDLTRGGLATALHELAGASGKSFLINENNLPFLEPVKGACEVLGIDPLYLASEGTMVLVVAPQDVERTLDLLHQLPGHEMAQEIGVVEAPCPTAGVEVKLQGEWGAHRRLEALLYEALPRIC